MTARDWLSRFSAIGEICLVLVLGNLWVAPFCLS